MNALNVKTAARLALRRYFAKGDPELSTDSYTAVVYPLDGVITVQWTMERKNGALVEKHKTFVIGVL